MRRFRRTALQQPSDVPFASERRKVGNLLAAAHARAKERARLLNEQRLAEAAKRSAEDEASRTRYLDQLACIMHEAVRSSRGAMKSGW